MKYPDEVLAVGKALGVEPGTLLGCGKRHAGGDRMLMLVIVWASRHLLEHRGVSVMAFAKSIGTDRTIVHKWLRLFPFDEKQIRGMSGVQLLLRRAQAAMQGKAIKAITSSEIGEVMSELGLVRGGG